MTSPTAAYEAGDDVTLRLVVTPEGGVPTDGTTAVVATATHDSGAAVLPVLTPNVDRSQWSGVLRGVAAGEWAVEWVVTGTGSGVRVYRFVVAASPSAAPVGRVYASTAQLSAYLDGPTPDGARRLLRRASAKVDELLLTATYRTDTAGMPVDAPVAAALAEATCAQVEWWGETGDDGTGAVAALAGARIGTVQLPGKAGTGDGIPEYAPAAVSALRRANLTGRGPIVYDRIVGGLLGQSDVPYYGTP